MPSGVHRRCRTVCEIVPHSVPHSTYMCVHIHRQIVSKHTHTHTSCHYICMHTRLLLSFRKLHIPSRTYHIQCVQADGRRCLSRCQRNHRTPQLRMRSSKTDGDDGNEDDSDDDDDDDVNNMRASRVVRPTSEQSLLICEISNIRPIYTHALIPLRIIISERNECGNGMVCRTVRDGRRNDSIRRARADFIVLLFCCETNSIA